MNLPHLLLADDSEASLAFGRAALAGRYEISTARSGLEAWEKVRLLRPAAVVLDLSMPGLDGDEVLARMQRDADLRRIPVIIASSERVRGRACLALGARAVLGKPVRAAELQATVESVLEQSALEATEAMSILLVDAGPLRLALPLDAVEGVYSQVATRPLPLGPDYLCELVDLHGEAVCVLDLCRRLAVPHGVALADRQLVVVRQDGRRLALCVDAVREPVEIPAESVQPAGSLSGGALGSLRKGLRAVVQTAQGLVAVLEPRGLASPGLVASLVAADRPPEREVQP